MLMCVYIFTCGTLSRDERDIEISSLRCYVYYHKNEESLIRARYGMLVTASFLHFPTTKHHTSPYSFLK